MFKNPFLLIIKGIISILHDFANAATPSPSFALSFKNCIFLSAFELLTSGRIKKDLLFFSRLIIFEEIRPH